MKLNLKKTLSKRERYAIYAACLFVGIFVVSQFIVSPLINKKKRLIRDLDVKTKILSEMQVLKSEYEALNKQADMTSIDFNKREKGFTLFSFLDKLSGQAGIKDHINYMKPSTTNAKDGSFKLSQVELKLKAIDLKQLTSYLYMIETSENMVFVKRLSVAQSTNPDGFIDVVMQVETYEI